MGRRKDRYYKVKKGPKSFHKRLVAAIARSKHDVGQNGTLETANMSSNNSITELDTKNNDDKESAAINVMAPNESLLSASNSIGGSNNSHQEKESSAANVTPCNMVYLATESDVDVEFIVKEENQDEDDIMIEGNRIVDFKYIWKQLQNISHHNSAFGCNLSCLKLTKETRKGFLSTFDFTCNICNSKLELFNCEKAETRADLNINDSAVSGFMSVGAGFSELQQVSASLNIPCMSDKLYAKCHTKVCELWELAKEKCMEETAKEELDLAVANGDIDANRVPMITVVTDGCWSK